MAMLHEPSVRAALEARLNAIRPDAPRQWGSMTVDQMLWHVNQFLAASVGEPHSLKVNKPNLTTPLIKFFLIYMPWPKSAPTNKGAISAEPYDLEVERTRCRQLIAKFVAKPLDQPWPADPSFGPCRGTFASKLQAKHLDHHFKQFNA